MNENIRTASQVEPADDRETSYLLQEPANARRLRQAVDELGRGAGQTHGLIDPEA